MENILSHLLQMSIYGSIAIITILILRRCFAKLPKRITGLFWIVAGVRLLCPVNFDMAFSLLNIAGEDRVKAAPSAIRPAVNAIYAGPATLTPHQAIAVNNTVIKASAFDKRAVIFCIWLAGMAVILSYLTIKTVRMCHTLKDARKEAGRDYYVSDVIDTSFVLGIIKPRVYMQSGLSKQEKEYIYLHELTHIRYMDHITRIIGVLAVCIHWFNPIVWIGFIRMCSDLEMRCDEAVIDRMGDRIRKEYCISIVEHARERGNVHAGLYAAFAGDNHNGKEIKMRVNNLIKYKKVSKILAAVVIIFAIGTVTVLSSKAAERKSDNEVMPTIELHTEEDPAAEQETEKVTQAGHTDEETSEEEHVGYPVGDPNVTDLNLTVEESLLNYGYNGMEIPDDVEYSDEGRPYSMSYDYRTDPTLRKLAEVFEKNGYVVEAPVFEYLDKQGNIKTGKELYHFCAIKGEYDVVNVNLCSEEYGEESFNEYEEVDGIRYVELEGDDWNMYRIWDMKTGVIMDAEGDGRFDWRSMGLFDAIR